jgi:hypothetical protein
VHWCLGGPVPIVTYAVAFDYWTGAVIEVDVASPGHVDLVFHQQGLQILAKQGAGIHVPWYYNQ